MSKRPGEDLVEEKDPLKKQKLAADLPSTSSSTANKISYGSLKSTAPSSSSSAISYAALRKQQVSTLKPPSTQSSISYASMALLQAQTKAAMGSSSLKISESQRTADSKSNSQQTQNSQQIAQGGNGTKEISSAGQSQAAPNQQSSTQSNQNPSTNNPTSQTSKQETTPSSSSQPSTTGFSDQPANAQPKTASQLNLKNQQLQILERAKKQKEEEQRLRLLKQQQAKKTLDGSGQVSFAQQQIQQQQQLLKAKEALKAKEKKPLTKYELEIEKLKKYAQKKEEEKKKIEKIYQMAREGKIVIEEHKRPFEEEIKVDSKEIDVRLDDKNNLVDSKGNVVVLEQKKTLLKVNLQKKQEEKLRKMMRNARVQNAQIFMDQNLFMTTSVKRDRKKVHALNFIEDTNKQDKKEEDLMQIEQDEEDKKNRQEKSQDPTKEGEMEEESGSSGSDDEQEIEKNEDFKSLIQKTEVDYKREEFQKSSSRYLQLLHKKKQSLKQKHHDPIPDIEWWDTPLFDSNRRYYLPLDQEQQNEEQTSQLQAQPQTNENNLTINILDNLEIVKHQLERLQEPEFAYSQETYKKDKLSNLIEHPRPFKNEGLPNMNQVVVIPNYMTQQERQKLRRRHRLEKERERQDKVKLGLLPPPPPKVKLKNMMRVLGNEAVADPSKMEALVRHGIEERLQEHLRRNDERKLTKEQKAEKFLRKLKRDSAIECRVALFRIENLHDRVHKFKVDISAQQMQLHGLLINPVISAESRSDNTMPAIVLVEGGPKSIKFYKKLLLRRIKWTKNSYIPKDENGNPTPTLDLSQNKCALVWEGVVKDHSFNKWRVIDTDNELEAKRAFSEKSVEFYFDMAINYQYPE